VAPEQAGQVGNPFWSPVEEAHRRRLSMTARLRAEGGIGEGSVRWRRLLLEWSARCTWWGEDHGYCSRVGDGSGRPVHGGAS
jgi:hypothetical protein